MTVTPVRRPAPSPIAARAPSARLGAAVAATFAALATLVAAGPSAAETRLAERSTAPVAAPQRSAPSQMVAPALAPSAAGAVRAVDARLAGDADRTRLVLDLTGAVETTAFTLDGPPRVVVEMPDVVSALPASVGREGRGLVRSFRFGLIAPGRSRLVIDAAGPVKVDRSFVLPPVDGQPARLVVDLVATTEAEFRRDVARAPRPMPAAATEGPLLSKGDRAPPKEAVVSGPAKPVIVLDPGHGGIDAGTWSRFSDLVEKEIVLEFAKALKTKLEATGRYQVVMTRETDVFVPLPERVRLAREAKADLFLSLHADAESQASVRGATVYTLSDKASDERAAQLAAAENKADAVAGLEATDGSDEVSDILIDLTRRETDRFSVALAREVVDAMRQAGKAIRTNPHRSAGFRVLKAHDVPSVLIELGFLSNREDDSRMRSPEWRAAMADVVAAAVGDFFGRRTALGR